MKQEYIRIRNKFKQGHVPIDFIKRWCEQEKKDYNVINIVLDFATTHPIAAMNGMQENVLKTMIEHFDYFFKLQILYNKENKEIKCS